MLTKAFFPPTSNFENHHILAHLCLGPCVDQVYHRRVHYCRCAHYSWEKKKINKPVCGYSMGKHFNLPKSCKTCVFFDWMRFCLHGNCVCWSIPSRSLIWLGDKRNSPFFSPLSPLWFVSCWLVVLQRSWRKWRRSREGETEQPRLWPRSTKKRNKFLVVLWKFTTLWYKFMCGRARGLAGCLVMWMRLTWTWTFYDFPSGYIAAAPRSVSSSPVSPVLFPLGAEHRDTERINGLATIKRTS